MRMREDTDLCICKNKAAYQIVSQITLNAVTERFFNQSTPRFASDFVALKAPGHFLPGNQWFEHRVPDALGECARQSVEALQLVVLGGVASQFAHGPAAYFFIHIAQEQRAVVPVFHVWRAGSDDAAPQFQLQTKIMDDLLRKEADQIGVTRQARLVIRKDLLRSRRAADVVVFFHYQ